MQFLFDSSFYSLYPLRILNIYLMIVNVKCDILGDVLGLPAPLISVLGLSHKSGKLDLLETLAGDIRTPDGKQLFQGDIVADFDKRKGTRDDGELWPEGRVPYVFHESVIESQKDIALAAMRHWEENTCIRFVEKSLTDLFFIRFRSDTAGCWSSVGRKTLKLGTGQDISLGVGCSKFYTAVHEIGHSLGYYHEHARSDRDKYVKVLWKNVKRGMNVQFEVKNTRNEEVEYDYKSIMHYPAWAFSEDPLSKNTIVSKNPFYQYLIDEEKDSLSFRDIKLTNIIYKCSQKCINYETTKCKNKGYLSPNTKEGIPCRCMCPPGFYGELCQFAVSDDKSYYGKQKCGGNITSEGPFTTPNYPIRMKEYESCGYWIRAPINHRVEVTFDDFSFCEPYDGEEKPGIEGKCFFESVEIRKSADIYNGIMYCGEQIKPGTVMRSLKRDFIILIIADDQMKGRGLNASVRFVHQKIKKSPKKKVKTETEKESNDYDINQIQQQSQLLESIPNLLGLK